MLNSVRDNKLTIPIVYTGMPEDVRFSEPLPDQVIVHILENGLRMRELRRSHLVIQYDMRKYFKQEQGNIEIPADVLRNTIEDKLPATSKLESLEPSSIRAHYEHPYTEVRFTRALQVRRVPAGVSVRTFPSEVEVSAMVRLDHFQEITEDDFKVYCDYPYKACDRLKVYVQVRDDRATRVRLNPDEVEYLIAK